MCARVLPRELALQSRLLLVGADILTVGAACAVAILAFEDRAIAERSAILAGILWLWASWWLGAYSRSFARVPRDEAYPAFAGGIFALVSFFLLSFVSLFHVDQRLGSFSIACCTLASAATRIWLHALTRTSGRVEPYTGAGCASGLDRAMKRALDLVMTIAALPLVVPLAFVVALIVAIDDGAPVFFRQERVGLGGRTFWMYKFRTMRRDAGDAWVVQADNRITRSGRFLRRSSLDELPQLFNVLRGDMSLVGPRPEMVAYAKRFEDTLPRYSDRHRLRPGITGWAQVTLPRNLSVNDAPGVLDCDLLYVDQWSIGLDCTIIIKTAAEVLFHRAV